MHRLADKSVWLTKSSAIPIRREQTSMDLSCKSRTHSQKISTLRLYKTKKRYSSKNSKKIRKGWRVLTLSLML